MKKFILAIVVAIAAVFPIASSAQSGDDMMYKIVKSVNDQNNPALRAEWEAPYLIMNLKMDKEGCDELNRMLADKETAPMIKDMLMGAFLDDPEKLKIFMTLEESGFKGMRFNITDKLGAKATLLVTMAEIRAYKDSKK